MYKHYQIAEADNPAALIEHVDAAMKQDWQPTGGIVAVPVVVEGQAQYKFLQALVHI